MSLSCYESGRRKTVILPCRALGYESCVWPETCDGDANVMILMLFRSFTIVSLPF